MNELKSQFLIETEKYIHPKKAAEKLIGELSDHIDDLAISYIDAGVAEDDAYKKALREIGSPETVGNEYSKFLSQDMTLGVIISLLCLLAGNVVLFLACGYKLNIDIITSVCIGIIIIVLFGVSGSSIIYRINRKTLTVLIITAAVYIYVESITPLIPFSGFGKYLLLICPILTALIPVLYSGYGRTGIFITTAAIIAYEILAVTTRNNEFAIYMVVCGTVVLLISVVFNVFDIKSKFDRIVLPSISVMLLVAIYILLSAISIAGNVETNSYIYITDNIHFFSDVINKYSIICIFPSIITVTVLIVIFVDKALKQRNLRGLFVSWVIITIFVLKTLLYIISDLTSYSTVSMFPFLISGNEFIYDCVLIGVLLSLYFNNTLNWVLHENDRVTLQCIVKPASYNKSKRVWRFIVLVSYLVFLIYLGIGHGLIYQNVYSYASSGVHMNLIPGKTIIDYIDKINNGWINISTVFLLVMKNYIIFIPLRLVLGDWVKYEFNCFILVFLFIISLELLQVILKIGVCDIDDIILNAAGYLTGLTLFTLSRKTKRRKL